MTEATSFVGKKELWSKIKNLTRSITNSKLNS